MELIDQEETTGPQGIKNTSGQSLHPFQTLNTHLHEKEEYSFFYDWVNACLENYYHTYRLNTEGLRVNLSWANVSPKMNEHRPHVHPNSWLSGIYYCTPNTPPTYFDTPLPHSRHGIVVQSESKLAQNVWQCPSDIGTLILFPSWLEHFTMPSTYSGTRMTISINVMPVGLTSSPANTSFGLIENVY
tara:strand:- start:3650 stop:4210 length:561 start_codon:yes stop_codon:yes gene_type:complete